MIDNVTNGRYFYNKGAKKYSNSKPKLPIKIFQRRKVFSKKSSTAYLKVKPQSPDGGFAALSHGYGY